ncbi:MULTISPECIES: HAD family phosphatase [unclassified Paludibacterium]|uniref:HAD family hydrolase n=1 Tax=unclassified Paludibacterium TaxID=2618429 RepID=UPI001C05D21B|nr:HAD family phosphatase [Paludibacterium sp. B53371]BEV72522.1 HAD family hydrolase [Paludibacterium sp. THUN1379]
MTIKAVLFDHDGTLVDSEMIHYRLWYDVLRLHGVDLPLPVYQQRYAGVPSDDNARDMVTRFELDVAAETLFAAKDQRTVDYLAQQAFPLMPGVPEMLDACRRHRLDLAVVTGANQHGVAASAREHACFSRFATMVSRDDVRFSKPEPDVYLLALERLELKAEECIAIEDTESGARAAHAAGIRCIAVPTALSQHHDFSGAETRCGNMGEAWHWIEQRV